MAKVLAAVLSIFVSLAFGVPQGSSSQGIVGRVRGANGAPVTGARVTVSQNGTSQQQVMTNAEGEFSLTNPKAGKYLLRVQKHGYRDSEQSLTLPRASDAPLIILLSEMSRSANINSESSEGIQFSDQPDFTVAGITDWTAAGGHGSDVNLRTSEALARDTRHLSSATPAEAARR